MSEAAPASGSSDDDQQADPAEGGGEDEGSTSHDGKDDHLKEDQKPITK